MLATPNDFAFVLAEAIRSACIKAALLAYDEAGIRGLCHEGRVTAPRHRLCAHQNDTLSFR